MRYLAAVGVVVVLGCSGGDTVGYVGSPGLEHAEQLCATWETCPEGEFLVTVEECARSVSERLFTEPGYSERCMQCMGGMTCAGIAEWNAVMDETQDSWPCRAYCPVPPLQ